MTVTEFTAGLEGIRRSTRKFLYVSIGAHLMLFAWMIVMQKITPQPIAITEITWVEAEPAIPKIPAAVARRDKAAAKQPVVQTPSPPAKKLKFQRDEQVAELTPRPQDSRATQDKLSERLATLQKKTVRTTPSVAALSSPSPVGRPRLAGVADERSASKPVELTRDGSPTATPTPLVRTERRVQRAAVVALPPPEVQKPRARTDDPKASASRTLAGARLVGPVADRPIVRFEKPTYPEWAKDEAVEGTVTIYFVVRPDGQIKENAMVQKTSGFDDFDSNAVAALLTWRFEPLAGGATGEQWGTITFHYRLADVN